jgi:hypothetical protein
MELSEGRVEAAKGVGPGWCRWQWPHRAGCASVFGYGRDAFRGTWRSSTRDYAEATNSMNDQIGLAEPVDYQREGSATTSIALTSG